MSLTKVAVERVAEVSGLSAKIVRVMLEDGWSFHWDIHQNLSWTRQGSMDLYILGKPGGTYPEPSSKLDPTGITGS